MGALLTFFEFKLIRRLRNVDCTIKSIQNEFIIFVKYKLQGNLVPKLTLKPTKQNRK